MKQIFQYLGMITVFFGCSGPSEPAPPKVEPPAEVHAPNTLSASVNGIHREFHDNFGRYSGGRMYITGSVALPVYGGCKLVLIVAGDEPGAYHLGLSSGEGSEGEVHQDYTSAWQYTPNSWTTHGTYDGEVVITAIDKEKKMVSGTFYFTGYHSAWFGADTLVRVASGKFDVDYY